MAKYGKKASTTVASAMHRRKKGTLRSGSGQKVTDPKQAIAIGLSEAREKGAKVPTKRAPAKRTSAKRASSKGAASTRGGSRTTSRKTSRTATSSSAKKTTSSRSRRSGTRSR